MERLIHVFITLFVLLFSSLAVSAQGFDPDDTLLGIGIGVGDRLGGNNLPIGAHFEKGITDKIAVGAYAGYSSFKGDLAKISYILVGGRGAYHYGNHVEDLPEELDLYGGLTIFYLNTNTKSTNDSPLFGQELGTGSSGRVDFGIFAGAKYYFSDQLGAFAELGTGLAWLQIGLAVRM